MSASNLRKATHIDLSKLPEVPESADSLFNSIEFSTHSVDPLITEYPYDQQKWVGSFVYSEPSKHTPGRSIYVDFEYRDESQILILNPESSVSDIQSLYDQFSRLLGDESRVYRNLHAPEDALWEFLESADAILEIDVTMNGKVSPYDDVSGKTVEEVVGSASIHSAAVRFEYEGEPILVRYLSGSLQIESEHGDAREYIIQRFERDVLNK